MKELTHIDEKGNVRMVDVGAKADTKRTAHAQAVVAMQPETLQKITSNALPKGDVLACARIAGIMAAKRTHELIPMCHPLPIDSIKIDISIKNETQLLIEGHVSCTYHTGVEMEALTACSVAALTIYDMCKAIDRAMEIDSICLLEKTGGKSGDFIRSREE